MMPRHSSLLLASCLLIDLAVMSLLVVMALGRPDLPELSAASWLDGRGATTLAPIIILKLALAGLLFLGRAGRERHSACLTATAWLWLATGKALGLHLIIGPILAVHLLVCFPIDAQTPQMIGKLLAMTAVAGVAVALLLGARLWASDRTSVQASQSSLRALALLGLAALIPELAKMGVLAGMPLSLAAFELAVELGVTSLLLVGAATSYESLPRTRQQVRMRSTGLAGVGAC